MDIRKPKPWHGLREFLKEYVTIVVGVLTALAAEQGVEWLHWRHEVAIADAGIRAELHTNGLNAYRHMVAWPCMERRLDQLSHDLRTTTGRWRGQVAHAAGGRKTSFLFPAQPWPATAWEEYRANGAVQHMAEDQRREFNRLFTTVAGQAGWGVEMGQAAAELAILADDLPLSEVTRDRELAAVEKARFAGYFANGVGKTFVERLKKTGIAFTEAETHPTSTVCTTQFTAPAPESSAG